MLERTDKNSSLPCRIDVSLRGLEWFVYNRTPAYDDILEGLTKETAPEVEHGESGANEQPGLRNRRAHQNGRSEIDHSVAHTSSNPQHKFEKAAQSTSGSDEEAEGAASPSPELPAILQFLPIHLECEKVAMVMGNDRSPAIFVVKADGISGVADAAKTRSPDPYRQLFRIQFRHPVVEMQENEDFKGDQGSSTESQSTPTVVGENAPPVSRLSVFRRQRKRAWHQLRSLVPYWRRSVESLIADPSASAEPGAPGVPGGGQWQGLSRYLNDGDEDDKTKWASVEYAAVSTVLDCPEASMTVYWDTVGKVPAKAELKRGRNNINLGHPPAWGINISLGGGIVNYGPWADRQRVRLQRVFFPGLCKDATPATALRPGDDRVATKFNLQIELDGEVKLQIPIREESKNWKWRNKVPPSKAKGADSKRRPKGRQKKPKAGEARQLRPSGWLDVKIPANATVSYSMDMVASANGFSNRVDVDLPGTEISSSVNHDLLWKSGPQKIGCDLSAPLGWNTMRSWNFDITFDDMELFLLRDHVFLLIDLVDDWSSGPPPDYLVFTPFKYFINAKLRNLSLFLNVNDANIINNPTSFENNTYLILKSPELAIKSCIPLDKYRPLTSVVPFEIRTDFLGAALNAAQWNTQASFLESGDFGHTETLLVDGQYHYNATTSTSNTDTLVINVSSQSPVIRLYGFIIRYFFNLKDNYFGDHVHFKTLEEYQEILQQNDQDPVMEKMNRQPPKKSNDMDVVINLRFDDPRLLIPANLYSARRYLQVEIPSASIDLRFTSYYMDMDLLVGPLSVSYGNSHEGTDTPGATTASTQLFVDGLHVFANRLFGMPPTETTYVCNYDVVVGGISGECTAEFLSSLIRGGSGLALSFDDEENALIPYSSLVFHDITFLRVSVESVRIWLHADEAAFLLTTGTIDVAYNDWARSHYSKRADINVPNIQLSCVDSESAARHRSRPNIAVEPEAFIETSLHLATIGRKFDFELERKLQQELVQREDQRTLRTPFLLIPDILDELGLDPVDPPAQAVPRVPEPVERTEASDSEHTEAQQTFPSQHQRQRGNAPSFASLGSKASSVIRSPSPAKSFHAFHQQDFLRPGAAFSSSGQKSRKRDQSVSSGRHSAFYSAMGDAPGKEQIQHSSVAFSSQYFSPYFPLESVQPQIKEAAMPGLEAFEDAKPRPLDFDLDDVDPQMLSKDHSSSSLLVEFQGGVTGYMNPTSIKYIANLLTSLQPMEGEDQLDDLQLDAVKQVLNLKKKRLIKGHIDEVLVRLPKATIRFLSSPENDFAKASEREQDQYDITLSQVAFVSRSSNRWTDPFDNDSWSSKNSKHFRLQSCEVSASQRLALVGDTKAAVMAQVDNVVVAMASDELTYIDVGIESIEASTASAEIEYIIDLAHRSTSMIAELSQTLSRVSSSHQDRMKLFIYRLVTDRQATVDPAFIIRPSAVLRSAKQHLRTFDSWRLITRLRQMWCTANPYYQEELNLGCFSGQPNVPQDALSRVITSFHTWRSWDLDNLVESLFLTNIFGASLEHDDKIGTEKPILAASRVGKLGFLLDPGSKQNKIEILDLAARVERKHHTKDLDLADSEQDVTGLVTTVNVQCLNAGVFMNWEIYEAVEEVLRIFGSSRNREDSSQAANHHHVKTDSRTWPKSALHVVLSLERGTFELNTINLTAKGISNGARLSVLIHESESGGIATNVVLSAQAATSRLHSHSSFLGTLQLREPSIFLSYALETSESVSSHTVKATAFSQSLSLVVHEDAITLLEVAGSLLKDETSALLRLKRFFPEAESPKKQNQRITERLSTFRVNLATFLNDYEIRIPLLRSLTYNIQGTVARAAMAANFGRELIFDFDVKENKHEMRIVVNQEHKGISLLEIPPTNGRVSWSMGATNTVTVFSSVEVIRLDAHAVYSLLRALNRPQISGAVADIKGQISTLQSHAHEIFNPNNDRSVAAPSRDPSLAYSVHMTLAGMEIFGNTPLKSESDSRAHLSFCLDKVHLEIFNKPEPEGPIQRLPEVQANLSQISFFIERGPADDMRSCGRMAFGATLSASTQPTRDGAGERAISFKSDGFVMELSPETISTFMDVLGYMGDKIKDIDTSRELDYLRKLRHSKPPAQVPTADNESDILDSFLSSVVYNIEIHNVKVACLSWTRCTVLSPERKT